MFDLTTRGDATRKQFLLGSDGAYFMTGRMIDDAPYHMSGLDESFEVASVASGATGPGPVRYDLPVPGPGLAELICWKINKGEFETFDSLTRAGMLPVLAKMGARGVGIWKLIYPEPAIGEEQESYDEVMMIVRYASYEHWRAAQDPARLIGNGPDFAVFDTANAQRRALIQSSWQRFIQGDLYRSPPTYAPVMNEHYRLTRSDP